MFDDPNVAARGMVRSFPVREGEVRAVGNAIKVVGVEERQAASPPALGADTESVMRSILDYDEERIERLRGAGVFGRAAVTTTRSAST